jgi:hypothetical protein
MTKAAARYNGQSMEFLRSRIKDHPRYAALLIIAALLLRVLVPAGFMPDFSSSRFQIVICTGSGPVEMSMDMGEMKGGKHGSGHQAQVDQPCGLAAPALAGADPIQLALALLFIAAAALFFAPVLHVHRLARLRPPLRGPPANA